MLTNSHGNSSGSFPGARAWQSYRDWDNTLAKTATNRIATEFASMAVFFGVGHLLDGPLDPKPVKHLVAKAIKPFLPQLDNVMDHHLTALESDEETQARQALTPDERAYQYADTAVDYGIRFGLSIWLQGFLQKHLDKATGLQFPETPQAGGAFGWVQNIANDVHYRASFFDKIVNVGGGAVWNTTLGGVNESLQDTVQKIFERAGMKEEQANSVARELIALQLPNMLGMAAAIGTLMHGQSAQPTRA